MFSLGLLIVYFVMMSLISIFCLIEFYLAIRFFVHERKSKAKTSTPEEINSRKADLPKVCIQLPVFNELYVIERLLEATAALEYPKDKLLIQLLDDSTDESVELAARKIEELKSSGLQIEHIRRKDRSGFKAGALQYGMERTDAELIAIFDADFIPDPRFILDTVEMFQDEKIGMVQTRWKHINEHYSLLTEVQAFMLDVHFSVEHIGRNSSDFFMNFNGTAGIWRKACIYDAGGWSADTITEDLDLSYRAQLKGWKFKYLDKVGSPSELPAEINGYKSQQYRWNKGGAEVAIKMIPRILKSNISLSKKVFAFHHLLSSSIYMIILLAGIISVPLLFFSESISDRILTISMLFLSGFLAIAAVYFLAYFKFHEGMLKGFFNFLYRYISFTSFSLGMALHNTKAVLSAYIGNKSPFIRTAKFNVKDKKDEWKDKKYQNYKFSWLTIGELFMALYFLSALIYAFLTGRTGLVLFHLLGFAGYAIVLFYTFKHSFIARSAPS